MERVRRVESILIGLRKRKSLIIKSILITLFILFILYASISIYFFSHFSINSKINGVDVSWKSVEDANKLLLSHLENYSLKIETRNNDKEMIYGKDIDLKYNIEDEIEELKDKQNSFSWIKNLFTNEINEMQVSVSYSDDLLNEVINSLDCLDEDNLIEPQNASFEYEDGKYNILEEVKGTKIDTDALYKSIAEAIKDGKSSINLDKANCYVEPKYKMDSKKVIETKETLDKYVGVTITYNFGDDNEVLNGDIIHNWLVIDDDLNITFDKVIMMDYVTALAKTYNTFGSTREFKNHAGNIIQVSGGDYGWVIDKNQEVLDLIENIKACKDITKEPAYSQKAQTRGSNDIGDWYVEIDLSNQHLWLFKDGNLIVESDVVTGNTSRNFDTPAGLYQVTYKERNATLRGEGYSTPVSFWIPFNGNIGMHDADTWRYGVYGGNIYTYNGSHGCVNLPYSAAETIYNNIEAGIPVICYN